uniref:Coiled-coil domain-containing protein 150 n=1 Tax=Leptobrachium leishanense TaxID=445787 RepID=A0A8C5M9H5_9ANUR
MERPVIPPFNIQATAPETFSVLQQRMRVAEEQTESLISDLQALGLNCHGIDFDWRKSTALLRPISPVKVRSAFVGDNDTLWRNCENLVNRMCRMESVMQTLKLGIFRLHTERKLNPKLSVELEQRLTEEHAQELRAAQLGVMRLRQRLNNEIEEREREVEAKERLSAALEIATATKNEVVLTAEKMKAAKLRMKERVIELQENLSREASLREMMEEEQINMLKRVEDMKQVVEAERMHVKGLQESCEKMHHEGQGLKIRLDEEELRCQELAEENQRHQNVLEAKDILIKQLQEEAQSLNKTLDAQCSELTIKVQRLSTEKTQLQAQHQLELKTAHETMEQKLQEKELMLHVTQASLTAELQNLQGVRTQLERELESLRAEHAVCQRKAMHLEQKYAVQKDVQESTISRLRTDLESALRDRAALESEKAMLQEEFNKMQSDLQEQKQNLEVELTENKLELGTVQNVLSAQEQENKRLMECVALMEQKQHSQRQVEMLLNELTESKNMLAYKNGKLQSNVDQLKSELQSLGDVISENSHLRKLSTAFETKYTQTNTELGSFRIRLQRTEARLQQAQTMLLRKEEDFTLAIKARDDAMKEEKRLRGKLEALEENEKQNRAIMQQQLSDNREERNRMSVTLENIVTSHTQLQQELEKLQTELGRKDSSITALQREREHCQKRIKTLEAELSECQMKLQSIESQKNAQIAPLSQAMEEATEDNKKLACALEQVLQKNHSLQSHVNDLENDLKSKKLQEQHLQILKVQTEGDMKIQQQQSEDRILLLKKQHQEEYKEAKRAAWRELTELKKALDCATANSTELSSTNRELRISVSDHEKTVSQQKNLIRNLKSQLRALTKSKETRTQTERVQTLEAELKQMEQLNSEFEKSNKEQSNHIEDFMAEVDSLRRAIKASSQKSQAGDVLNQLEKERQSRKKLEDKCMVLEQKVQELHKDKKCTEEKLKQASVESEQISRNLEEAHSWFQSQFEELQVEAMKRHRDNKQSSFRNTKEEDSVGNNVKNQQHLPQSLSHFETKQQLKLISRNYQPNEENGKSAEQESNVQT